MYNFSQHLMADEKILYQGRSVPGKGGKAVGGLVFLIFFALAIQGLMIWSVITKTGDGANGINLSFIVIFLAVTLFLGLGVYGLFYNLVLKKKVVADDFYCLTNMRAMKYEMKKNKLVFGYLAYYDEMRCDNVKDNFGDFYMGIVFNDEYTDDSLQTIAQLKNIIMNPNPENMPFINFESIENPYQVMKLAKEAKQNILQKEQ